MYVTSYYLVISTIALLGCPVGRLNKAKLSTLVSRSRLAAHYAAESPELGQNTLTKFVRFLLLVLQQLQSTPHIVSDQSELFILQQLRKQRYSIRTSHVDFEAMVCDVFHYSSTRFSRVYICALHTVKYLSFLYFVCNKFSQCMAILKNF